MEAIFEKVTRHISKEQRISFISTFAIGIIVHLFMLSNKIPNHDDVGQLYNAMNRPASGRWFLVFPSKLSGDLSLPWFNGVLGIIYISLCAMSVIWFCQVKSRLCIVAVSAVMVTFPAVASTFNYMAVGDSYFFGLLLACLSTCFMISAFKLCWAIAVVLLTLSMGIYQAYLPFAVAMLVIWHIKKLLIEDRDVREVFLSGIKCICAVGISVAAYLTISKLIMKYQGAEIAGHIAGFVIDDLSLKSIVWNALTAFKKSLWFYLFNESGVHYDFMNYLYALVLLIALVFSMILFKNYNQKKSIIKNILLMFLYAILPLASGLIYCMCAQVHMLMIYGFVALLLFPLILTDQIEKSNIMLEGMKGNLMRLGQIATVLIILTGCFDYATVSNKAYLSLYLTYEQSYAYANRLLTEIQIQDEYEKADKLILIGAPTVDTEYTMPWREEKDVQSLRGVTVSLTNSYTFSRYLRYYLGAEQEVSQVTSLEQLEELETDIDFNELNCYPNAGSIVCENDRIFVKFNDIN